MTPISTLACLLVVLSLAVASDISPRHHATSNMACNLHPWRTDAPQSSDEFPGTDHPPYSFTRETLSTGMICQSDQIGNKTYLRRIRVVPLALFGIASDGLPFIPNFGIDGLEIYSGIYSASVLQQISGIVTMISEKKSYCYRNPRVGPQANDPTWCSRVAPGIPEFIEGSTDNTKYPVWDLELAIDTQEPTIVISELVEYDSTDDYAPGYNYTTNTFGRLTCGFRNNVGAGDILPPDTTTSFRGFPAIVENTSCNELDADGPSDDGTLTVLQDSGRSLLYHLWTCDPSNELGCNCGAEDDPLDTDYCGIDMNDFDTQRYLQVSRNAAGMPDTVPAGEPVVFTDLSPGVYVVTAQSVPFTGCYAISGQVYVVEEAPGLTIEGGAVTPFGTETECSSLDTIAGPSTTELDLFAPVLEDVDGPLASDSYTWIWQTCVALDNMTVCSDISGTENLDSITVGAGLYRLQYTTNDGCVFESAEIDVTEPEPLSYDFDAVVVVDSTCQDSTDGSITGIVLARGTLDMSEGTSATYAWYRCGDVGQVNDVNTCFTGTPIAFEMDLIGVGPGVYALLSNVNSCAVASELFTITGGETVGISLCEGQDVTGCDTIVPSPVSCNADNSQPGQVPSDGSITGVKILNTLPGNAYVYKVFSCDSVGPCNTDLYDTDVVVAVSNVTVIPTIENLSAGYYSISVEEVIASECSALSSFSLEVAEPEFIEPVVSNTTIITVAPTCSGSADGSISVVPGFFMNETETYFFLWYRCSQPLDDPTLALQGACGDVYRTERNITAVQDGYYYLFVNTTDGCLVVPPASTAILTGRVQLTLNLTQIEVEPPSCFGDDDGSINSAAAYVEGGTPPYSFAWYKCTEDLQCGLSPDRLVSTEQFPNNLAAGGYIVAVQDSLGCTVDSGNILITDGVEQPDPITADFDGVVVTSTSCHSANGNNTDGSLTGTIDVEGGTPPYTFTFTGPGDYEYSTNEFDGVFGLRGGYYNITITDANNCPAVADTFLVYRPDRLVINALEADVIRTPTCRTGYGPSQDGVIMATVDVSGGTPPYMYGWTDGVFSTEVSNSTSYVGPAGTYFLKVIDANGCVATSATSITVPEPDELSLFGQPAIVAPTCSLANPSVDPDESLGFVDISSLYITGATEPVFPAWYRCDSVENPDVTFAECRDLVNQALISPIAVDVQTNNLEPGNYAILYIDARGCYNGTQFFVPAVPSFDVTVGAVVSGTCDDSVNIGGAMLDVAVVSEVSDTYDLQLIYCGADTVTPPSREECNENILRTVTLDTNETVSFNNLPTGVYYVDATNGEGCQATTTATGEPIVIVNSLAITDLDVTDAICQGPTDSDNGSSVTVTIAGGIDGSDNRVILRNEYVNNPNYPEDPTVWGVRNVAAPGPETVTFGPLYRGTWTLEVVSTLDDGNDCRETIEFEVGGYACIDPASSIFIKSPTRRGILQQYGEGLLQLVCDQTYEGGNGTRPLHEDELTLEDLDIYIYGPVDGYMMQNLTVNGIQYYANGSIIPYSIAYPEAGLELHYMGDWIEEGYVTGQWVISFIPPEAGYYNVTIYPLGPPCDNLTDVNIPIANQTVQIAVGEGYGIDAWGLCEGVDCCAAVSDCLIDLEANVDIEDPKLMANWRRAPCLCPYPVCACGYTYDSIRGQCVKYLNPLTPELRHEPYHSLEQCLQDYVRSSEGWCTQPLERAWFKCKKAAGFS